MYATLIMFIGSLFLNWVHYSTPKLTHLFQKPYTYGVYNGEETFSSSQRYNIVDFYLGRSNNEIYILDNNNTIYKSYTHKKFAFRKLAYINVPFKIQHFIPENYIYIFDSKTYDDNETYAYSIRHNVVSHYMTPSHHFFYHVEVKDMEFITKVKRDHWYMYNPLLFYKKGKKELHLYERDSNGKEKWYSSMKMEFTPKLALYNLRDDTIYIVYKERYTFIKKFKSTRVFSRTK